MTLVALFVNGVLMMALPVAFAIGVRRGTGARGALFLFGALAFVGSQVVHVPILWAWSAATRAGALPALGSIGDGIALGALAALCEEPARALVFSRLPAGERGRDAGLAVGAGHGGIEALIFGAMALLSAVNLSLTASMTEADLVALGTPPEAAATAIAQIHAALATPWWEVPAGAVERAMAIPFHAACSLLVAASIRRRSAVPFVAAVGLHAVTDTIAVLAAGAALGTWGTELVLAAFTVPATAAAWIWAFRAEPRTSATA